MPANPAPRPTEIHQRDLPGRAPGPALPAHGDPSRPIAPQSQSPGRRETLRDALAELPRIPPKTRLGQALSYLLGQKPSLLRCLTEPKAEIENNAVERAIRPLKIGAKNWMQIGHPKAGPRLANLFTLVENCRQKGVDPEPTSSTSSPASRSPDEAHH